MDCGCRKLTFFYWVIKNGTLVCINATSSASKCEHFLKKFFVMEIFVSLIIKPLIVFEDEGIKMFEKYPKLLATLRNFVIPETLKVQEIAFHHHCHVPEYLHVDVLISAKPKRHKSA